MKKNYAIITAIFFFGLISCKKEEYKQKSEPKKIESKTLKTTNENINPIFSERDYTLLFKYSDGESTQLIGINIVDKKTIQFHIVTETLPCDTEYWGTAENKNWNGDSESDEDENGGYLVDEYFSDKGEYIIGIRLASDSTKVVIKYIKNNKMETDCLPITDEILKRIK